MKTPPLVNPGPALSGEQTRRYSRQIVIPQIQASGQERIGNAKVLCIGAGGLGSPALMYLAAAGVGTIGIVDFDVEGIFDSIDTRRTVSFVTDAHSI